MEQRHSECSEFLCPDKFYVCDLRTKHKRGQLYVTVLKSYIS